MVLGGDLNLNSHEGELSSLARRCQNFHQAGRTGGIAQLVEGFVRNEIRPLYPMFTQVLCAVLYRGN